MIAQFVYYRLFRLPLYSERSDRFSWSGIAVWIARRRWRDCPRVVCLLRHLFRFLSSRLLRFVVPSNPYRYRRATTRPLCDFADGVGPVATLAAICPELGVKQTRREYRETDAIDPEPTFTPRGYRATQAGYLRF
jgi:hypothetical protein